MNRSDARMIAEELHKFIRNDVRKAVTEMATAETEEYLNAKQAAVFLGWKLQTLYNRIHDIPHTKNGKSLIFTKSALRKFMERKESRTDLAVFPGTNKTFFDILYSLNK